MSLPSRVVPDFVSGNVIKSQEFDDEFSRLYGIFRGDNLGISIRVLNSDNSFACARFDQTGANHILELFANSAEVFRFEKDGDIIFPSLSSAAGIYTFANQPVFPNMKTAFSISPWFYSVMPQAVEATESVGRWIVPPGTEIQIIDIVAVWAAGSDSSASNVFTIKRRNAAGTLQADVGTIDINTPAQNGLQVTTLGSPLTLTAGDQLYPLKTTHNAPASEQLIGIGVRGKQKLTA